MRKGSRKRSPQEVIARNDRGEKQCRSCWEWLDEDQYLSEIRNTSDGLASRCKACDRFRRYGLTRVDVINLLTEQENRCPICSKTFLSFRDFIVDHAHACCNTTGGQKTCGECTRGLICQYCNVSVLGTLENPVIVASAFKYLEKYKTNG